MNENIAFTERYRISSERIRRIITEKSVADKYRPFFIETAEFILQIEQVYQSFISGLRKNVTIDELAMENRMLYADILPENYESSYANPHYAVEQLGDMYGAFLSAVYTEIRGMIAYVFEEKVQNLAILCELFIEIYNNFEEKEEPEYKILKDIFYWYASDYCDVFAAGRVEEQMNPAYTFAADIIQKSDLTDLRFLYQYGEYISENERKTAAHLNSLPDSTIQKMADSYTEGFRIGFVKGNKDLTKKKTVNIRYTIGFERVVKAAIDNFSKMGLKPTICRAAVSVLTRRQQYKIGYFGAIANKQYEYDHREDQGLFLDKRFMERKLDVFKNVYEQNKQIAAQFAGPAVIEVFGAEPFSPVQKPEAVALDEGQEKLSLKLESKSGQLANHYMKGEERSFTIVAYPSPEIGDQYEEIFDEVIRINTLDAGLYEQVQQAMIDALDQGKYVHILGQGANKTDLKVQLYRLQDPQSETIFENCVADVNIPVGEVFTTPVLAGTNGVLHVSRVYLNELEYRDLEIHFEDGMITEYTCRNFSSDEENKKYIKENILRSHDTLPLGEFAIGTNTTAYAAARKYHIEDKMPILIAEKMGPHFAVGDTCYSWSEENRVYNPDGKEIVAKDNEVSVTRKDNLEQAYYHCHTDITIPYEELKQISVVTEEGEEVILLKDSRFVLSGTEMLNKPLDRDR